MEVFLRSRFLRRLQTLPPMTFVARRRTRDSVDSRIRPRVSSALSQLFSRARRVSVEPPRPIASDGTSFPQWLTQFAADPVTTSPTPSFEIRRPSGLGQRSNSFCSDGSLGSIRHAVVVGVGHKRPGHYRHPSASEPNLLHLAAAQHDAHPVPCQFTGFVLESQTTFTCETQSDSASLLSISSYVHAYDIPSQIWENVTRFLPHQDLPSLARVSSDTLPHARKAMYEDIDLQSLPPDATRLCIKSLGSYPELALFVQKFKSPILPSFDDVQGPLPSLSFAFALSNMKNITSLSLPHFDNNIFHHTTFRLQHLILSCETMSIPQQAHFSSWLTTQHHMVSLSLPALTTELSLSPCVPVRRPSDPDRIDLGRFSFPTPPSRSLSIPNLRKFDGPISLVQGLVPGRPVSEVVIYVDKTLYDGLKPSQLMCCIARSTASIERLSIRSSPSAVIDARTMERLLMSAGAEFGPSVLHLEISWTGDDEVRTPLSYLYIFLFLNTQDRQSLYRHMLSIMPRFSNLQTLNCVPTSASPVVVPFATINEDPLINPVTPTPSLLPFPRRLCPETAPTPQLLSLSSPTPPDSGASDVARARERQFIRSWVKVCPSLTVVTFLCGAEWCVIRRRRRISVKDIIQANVVDNPPMCVPSFVRWRHA